MKAFDKLRSWLHKKLGEEGDAHTDHSTAAATAAPTAVPPPAAAQQQHHPAAARRTSSSAQAVAAAAAAEGSKAAAAASSSQQSAHQQAKERVAKELREGVAKEPPPKEAAVAAAAKPEGAKAPDVKDFFTEYGEANRYLIKEIVGKGSYGIVASAIDNFTGEKVAIKKITNVFEHVSDATRILREIKLLRMLKHPDIVEIKHIMLPPTRDYRDIYVVFELMETDLHQVIKANDDLTAEHHQFFLYQMLRGLKYIHSAKVFHRDLKPKNILANADCKLKICDFGLARPAFADVPTTIFWTDYVATRWYRAPELCGSFFAKYSPAIDLWSIGCIFAEVLLGKPLFAGRNVVNQLEIITDLLGTPSAEVIGKVRNEKARRFLTAMPRKARVPFAQHFPRAEAAALDLLQGLLAFDPAERPTAEQALSHPYFNGLHAVSREPSAQPVSKLAFEFDRRKLTMEDVRDLIYDEILEYHPRVQEEHTAGNGRRLSLTYPSALDNFKRQFAYLEAAAAATAAGVAAAGASPGEPDSRSRTHDSAGGTNGLGAEGEPTPGCSIPGVTASRTPTGRTPTTGTPERTSASSGRLLQQATSLPKPWLPEFSLDGTMGGGGSAGGRPRGNSTAGTATSCALTDSGDYGGDADGAGAAGAHRAERASHPGASADVDDVVAFSSGSDSGSATAAAAAAGVRRAVAGRAGVEAAAALRGMNNGILRSESHS